MAKVPKNAGFVEPMLLLRAPGLPDGEGWLYEVKLDGYRAIAIKSGGKVRLRSRNDKDFSRYSAVLKALQAMPDETVLDGEIVALDESGRPSFNALQNYGSANAPVFYFLFDVMMHEGQYVMHEPLELRRAILEEKVLPTVQDPVRYSIELNAPVPELIKIARERGLEGLVAKGRDSVYEPGLRSGAWVKVRLNQGQEFVIAGYTPSPRNFDGLIFGYYEAGKLMFAAKTRNGFTPASREALFKRFRGLETDSCPFANLPEKREGRWGQGITASKMIECRWLKPELVGQFEFVEWTPDAHLRHSAFIGLREDKKAKDVKRE